MKRRKQSTNEISRPEEKFTTVEKRGRNAKIFDKKRKHGKCNVEARRNFQKSKL